MEVGMSTRATLSVEYRMHDDGSDRSVDRAEVLDCLSDKSPIEDSIRSHVLSIWVEMWPKMVVLVLYERAQIRTCQKQQPCSGRSSDKNLTKLRDRRRVESKSELDGC